jgi:tetratricopeptide (TPR) repeat protein
MNVGKMSRAIALPLIALAVVTGPAAAAKKKDGGIAMEDAFRTQARNAQAVIASGDIGAANAAVVALMPSNDLEKYVAAGLRMEVASRRGDPQAQRKALTDMLESKSVPERDIPYLRFLAGYYSYYLGEFDDAIAQVNYARQLGYRSIDSTILLADATLKKGKRAEGMAIVNDAFAQQRSEGAQIPAPWFDKAAAFSYQLGNWPDVARWYREKLAAYPGAANWRSALVNVMANPNLDAQLKLDLYRLQAATGAMASERDYQAYAAAASGNGYNSEAKAIIESGRSSGKLAPTETVTAALLKATTPKAAKDLAALPALASKAAKAPSGVAAQDAGDAYFAVGQYPRAVEEYRLALTKGGVDAGRVNTRLGVALARSGDLPGARSTLSQVNGGAWADIAHFWAVWVDQQAQRNASLTPSAASPSS